jgi:hypothetical protein
VHIGYVRGNALIRRSDDIISLAPVGSENGVLTVYRTTTGIEVTRGCFTGSLEEFETAVRGWHGNNKYAQQYLALVKVIEKLFN